MILYTYEQVIWIFSFTPGPSKSDQSFGCYFFQNLFSSGCNDDTLSLLYGNFFSACISWVEIIQEEIGTKKRILIFQYLPISTINLKNKTSPQPLQSWIDDENFLK